MSSSLKIKLIAAIVVIVVLVTFKLWVPLLGLPSELPDGETLRQWFNGWGVWGPVAIIVTMILAILISPVPSAPIALAAGAIYGHYWGTLYVLIGAEIGALAAFGISRYLGFEVLHNWFGAQLKRGLAGSQNFLMATVFISRLLPFISFDIVSYAAGLTTLSFWRFALATLAGIVPMSFVLAHFGAEMVADEMDRIIFALVALGLLGAAPFIYGLIKK
ncbi:MAG: TVP38/TMEM64 family protein [Rhizobiaceae bacterium]|nr:TVP38/TMEM64 family protein [Rhizobiaceae bacterium]